MKTVHVLIIAIILQSCSIDCKKEKQLQQINCNSTIEIATIAQEPAKIEIFVNYVFIDEFKCEWYTIQDREVCVDEAKIESIILYVPEDSPEVCLKYVTLNGMNVLKEWKLFREVNTLDIGAGKIIIKTGGSIEVLK